MDTRRLGRTDIEVSRICLGTMTWGEQNSEAEAHAQMDAALDAGVNFIDAAEMYPVPTTAETQGRTERYIGSWLEARGRRDEVVLASKVAGRSAMTFFRDGGTRLDRGNIEAAVEASLGRLRTDYIDLYYLHWPDRQTNFFGQLGYVHDDEEILPLEETLAVLDDLVAAGKLRQVGISNETPWGMTTYLRLAEMQGGPRICGIQNPYSLLNRSFEVGLAEIAIREDCGLMAHSPLAMGALTGKYVDGARPEGARLSLWPDRFKRYLTARGADACRAYLKLARDHGLDPAQMAIAYVLSRPFVTSAVVGATSTEQLAADIAAADLALMPEVIEGIEAIHARIPNPCP